ncbi:hypothetical protein AB4Z48_29115 [Cupriavidus sp. 2TAF22]|uniref:hypothetical protein n=1 Tax=unclassified Cupriavidus TaxID=2640874 RepID=UPI003F8DD1B2
MVPGIPNLAYQLLVNVLQELQADVQAGTAGYLQVLVADAQYHQAEIGYLQARTRRLQGTAALFLALGGSWDASAAQAQARPPS